MTLGMEEMRVQDVEGWLSENDSKKFEDLESASAFLEATSVLE